MDNFKKAEWPAPPGYRFARMNEPGTHAVCKHGNIVPITAPVQPCLWTVLVKVAVA